MLVFKGFDKNLRCSHGEGVFQYASGVTAYADSSMTRASGLHSSEYVLECLRWYPLPKGGRVFLCEAGGDIDENEDRIVCSTELTPLRELSGPEIIAEALSFMMRYPLISWESDPGCGVRTAEDSAEASENELLIVRGRNPKAKGEKGSVIGLCAERDGKIFPRMLRIGRRYRSGVWYTFTGQEIREVAP